MSAKTLGAQLSHNLKNRGVDTIFGIPGVHNIELYRGIEDAGITHILARHEQGAGFMADGYARATGKPGVAFVISGPGLTNIMTAMGQAYSDSVPILVISSCLPQGAAAPGRLHQMRDQTGAGETVCDWSVLADNEDMAFDTLERAFDELANQRGRSKHITIPMDLLENTCENRAAAPATLSPIPPDSAQISELTTLLDQSEKPIFVFGGGSTHASDAARELVDATGAAVFSTYAGRGVIDPDQPLNYGAYLARPESATKIGEADLVIVVGTELGVVDLRRTTLGNTAKLVRIDIDPAVLNDPKNADLKLQADARLTLRALNEQITKSSPKWDAKKIATAKMALRADAELWAPECVPYIDAMQRAMPADALIYSDMTQFAYVAKEIYPVQHPNLWHHPYGFGTLGYALPAAIGGKIALPDRPVVAIAGDYGFQYTIQELGVASELSLPMPIILWDNGRLKEIEDSMVRSQIAPNAVVAKNPDFKHLSAAYDIGYSAPATPAEFEVALRAALNTDGPTIVHISPD